jgi:uncharacterized protein DUF4389
MGAAMEHHPPMEPEQARPGDGLHPIRIVVADDLERSRLTVFFRLLLAIPLYIWFVIWSFFATLISIVNWVITLVKGSSPASLHDFFGAYVRFTTHLHAYVLLAADPYPGFTGKPGYPIDVEVDPPAPQQRWKTLIRFFLALPALILATVLVGAPGGGGGGGGGVNGRGGDDAGTGWGAGFGSTFLVVSVLAWFACLARARMPRGIRDLFAYGLRYAAQAGAYLFFLTDRYPNADPALPPAAPPEKPRAVRLHLTDDLRRSRLTVFFRLLLFLPHLVWLALWGIAVFFAAIVNWFATLATGRSPAALHRFLAAYVRYSVQVTAFLFLIANPFPGFVGAPGYPVEVEIDGPEQQHRARTAFRLFLAVPAFIIAGAFSSALQIVGVFGWFAGLALGRMPLGLRNLGAWAIRYEGETHAYFLLLTETYPYSGAWEFAAGTPELPEPEPEPEAAFA